MNGSSAEVPTPLSDDLIVYYRRVLAAHSIDPVSRVCPVCGVKRCADWQQAYERLVVAGVDLESRVGP
ncbi:hypothetical protein GCM10009681_32440 [Luedemannella helvata]|uniref:Uncharacterized protein n=1 Tax=Luedemannella helvata TaxID=349315 RepID=A0ABN2KKI3_9ACTN